MATKITTRVLADNAVTDAKIADVTLTTSTQSASDNTTKIATTAYVTTAIANLADSAPSTLNTLNELAAALGDDANYATTTTNAIAAKLPLSGGTLTGDVTFNGTNLYFNGAASSAGHNLALENSDTFTSFFGSTSSSIDKGYQFFTGNQGGDLAFTINADKSIAAAGALTVAGGLTVNSGHVNIDSGLSYQWGDSHERIEQSDQKIEFFTNNGQQMTLFGGNLGIGTILPNYQLEVTGSSDGDLTSAIFANTVQGGTNDTVAIELQLAGTSGQVAASTLRAGKGEDWTSGTSRSGFLAIEAVLDGTNRQMAYFGSDGDGSSKVSFSTNNSEAMRINSTGDMLFGGITDKNVFNNTSGTGTSINNNGGEVQIANNNDTCLYLNRMGSNGTLVSLRQAGTNYGTIGIFGGAPYIGHTSGGLMFNGTTIEPTAGVTRVNNTVNLGSANYKFKDLEMAGYINKTGVLHTSAKQYYYNTYGEHHIRTGGRHGTGTYTLFTNGSSSTQSAGIVEVWGIYGTPSGASYRKYLISGNRSIATITAEVETNSVPEPTLAWSGATLQISNGNGSLFYHVKVTLHDIGIGWSPTWGNLPGIS